MKRRCRTFKMPSRAGWLDNARPRGTVLCAGFRNITLGLWGDGLFSNSSCCSLRSHGLLLSTRDHLAAKCRSEIACGSIPPVLILSFHLVSYGLACGVPSLEELSRDVQKQVEVHCKYMWQQRSLMPWLPGKPSPRILCDGDGERHEGCRGARGRPWVSTSPTTCHVLFSVLAQQTGSRGRGRNTTGQEEGGYWECRVEDEGNERQTWCHLWRDEGELDRTHSPGCTARRQEDPGGSMSKSGDPTQAKQQLPAGPCCLFPLLRPPTRTEVETKTRPNEKKARLLVYGLVFSEHFLLGFVQNKCHSAGYCISVSFFLLIWCRNPL